MIILYIRAYLQGTDIACCLLRLVHAKVISQNGSTTQHRQDVSSLFMVDVKEIQIGLTLERAVRLPVYVVSLSRYVITNSYTISTLMY